MIDPSCSLAKIIKILNYSDHSKGLSIFTPASIGKASLRIR